MLKRHFLRKMDRVDTTWLLEAHVKLSKIYRKIYVSFCGKSAAFLKLRPSKKFSLKRLVYCAVQFQAQMQNYVTTRFIIFTHSLVFSKCILVAWCFRYSFFDVLWWIIHCRIYKCEVIKFLWILNCSVVIFGFLLSSHFRFATRTLQK